MADGMFNKGKYLILSDSISLSSDTLKVMLVTSSYTFDKTHNFVGDVSSNELSVSGYTGGFAGAGRKTVASKTFTEDDTNHRAVFAVADITWTSLAAGQTIGGAILIKEVTNDAASPLIAFFDLTNTATTGANVTLDFSSTGLFYI